ncbi:MAG: 23S rRNA (uracil(1939)-C(5))-methyltransferase RlmD [Lachnospiraceae bacterium]|jgi:23S rRNA (uracil1939-C5)-methyltransferase|nr:23S rRNA (uracil(1939)-C(5))-methyltransferase RlmD [Lachnospiraceae bacterium]
MGEKACALASRCGGCQYMGMPYERQLVLKEEKVRGLFPKYKERIEPIIGMEDPYHYRCKVQATFGLQKGRVVSGTYEPASHRLVAVEDCLIEDEQADRILATIRALMISFKLMPYDEDHRRGVLRHVLIRKGYVSGEILVVLVTGSYEFPGKNHFVKALCHAHPEIRTVIHNVNGRKTSMILGPQQKTIMGPGYITDRLMGHTFRISAASFYQVNPPQTERLYAAALQMLQLSGRESVLDAYCGTGTIGILAAQKAGSVIGVELNRQAVQDAIVNAKLNQVRNIRFVCEDAGRFLQRAAAQQAVPQVVIMDPPRGGSDEAFLSALAAASSEKIVYISCNPETQTRDTAYLVKRGYEIKRIQPVDLFPMTEHVETIVLLSHN